jgi:signal transduction histidine kinase
MFTDILRHDLVNPIGVIKNYMDLLSDEDLEPDVRHALDSVSRNIIKALGMVESASKLAKVSSEEDIKFEKMDVGEIIKEAIDLQKSDAEKKNITLHFKSKGRYPAFVNRFIEDVFLNFISNAVKYSPENSNVEVGILDEDKNWKIFVKDSGEGIPDKFKEAVFTRFERLKREGVKGTGLGLAIAKKITEIHKGRVWVEDNPEGGSIFYAQIPKDLRK